MCITCVRLDMQLLKNNAVKPIIFCDRPSTSHYMASKQEDNNRKLLEELNRTRQLMMKNTRYFIVLFVIQGGFFLIFGLQQSIRFTELSESGNVSEIIASHFRFFRYAKWLCILSFTFSTFPNELLFFI
ncbi:hypothetical protein Tcan_11320 [Toxocara canis]|uniref:Uncharacterized protein n=1 Tax=Toxocara canis TaxID=6265 RepID=A0A0B2VY29_TOXCA|nr:hypothetical protein Tcan_11320 [Toxocara canis]